jgi:rubrerythrin
MNPHLQPLATRWDTFMTKVRARVAEVEGEAKAAYDEVIATEVIDGTALSGVSSAIKSRLQALRAKVDDSWNVIDNEADKLDVPARDLGLFRAEQRALGNALAREIDHRTEEMIVRGEAAAARALYALAERERGAKVACAQCGAELMSPAWFDSVNITCPSCGAVTTAYPGTAAMTFFRGSGAIQLAREASWPAWLALQDAEAAWRELRHKTLDDLARFEQAHIAYWRAYGEAMARVHPAWSAQRIADEVRGKMSWFYETTAKDDRTVRETNQAGLAAVAAGDAGALKTWAGKQRDAGSAYEDLLQAVLERGWHEHARWLAQVAGISAEDLADAVYWQSTR